jgi:hypothetical protein
MDSDGSSSGEVTPNKSFNDLTDPRKNVSEDEENDPNSGDEDTTPTTNIKHVQLHLQCVSPDHIF